MAEETVDRAIEKFNLSPKHPHSRTEGHSLSSPSVLSSFLFFLLSAIPLVGGNYYRDTSFIELIQKFGIEKEVAEHLSKNYGDRAVEV